MIKEKVKIMKHKRKSVDKKLLNVLKIFAEGPEDPKKPESPREKHLSKFRKFQHDGDTWFKKTKTKLAEKIEKAFIEVIDDRLQHILTHLNPDFRSFSLGSILFPDSIFQKMKDDEDYLSLRKYNIPWISVYDCDQESEARKIFIEKFLKYLKSEGFRVSESQGYKFKDMGAVISWEIPSHYGVDFSDINWRDIYDQIQSKYYHGGLHDKLSDYLEDIENEHEDEDGNVTETDEKKLAEYKKKIDELSKLISFHADAHDKIEEDLEKTLNKYKLNSRTLLKPYESELEDWFDDVKDDGEKPSYKLKLDKPPKIDFD